VRDDPDGFQRLVTRDQILDRGELERPMVHPRVPIHSGSSERPANPTRARGWFASSLVRKAITSEWKFGCIPTTVP
jgi:hypothetical protein